MMAMVAPDPKHRSPSVLMTADTLGGVWPYAVNLCASMPETRFVVATMGPRPSDAQRAEIARLDNASLVESDYRLEWMAGADADFAASRAWLVSEIALHNVDLVHINGYAHACLGIDCPVLVVAHSDVLSWWKAVHGCAPPPEWDCYRDRVRAGLAAAAQVVAPTASILCDLERHYLRLWEKADRIPNGVDLASFPSLPKRPVVIAAGRLWDAAKNLAALDAVAADLTWPVEISGTVEHPESGAARFANARLLGMLPPVDMARRLASASVFSAPAPYEPFGLAILEAAAAGCALVLGDIASLRETWDGAAVFVDPNDPSALRCAIGTLIANAGQRYRVAAAAQQRAQRFTLRRMAQSYADLYREVARNCAYLEIA